MKSLARVAATAATVALALAATAAAASAADPVFVQTDNPSGNQIAVYDRAADGTLTPAGTYDTGGVGGVLKGSVVDHLASQRSLYLDRAHQLLYAVNAGSNTISVFTVNGDKLHLLQVLSSHGVFPVSFAVHQGLVYVLNAKQGGSLHGYAVTFGRLQSLSGSTRQLGLDPHATPQFTTTPGQAAFSQDGSQLMVTTKGNTSSVDVFGVNRFGLLSSAPRVNHQPGAVPFAIGFDPAGHPLVTDAGPNALTSFDLSPDRVLTQISSVATGGSASCWVTRAGRFMFVSNTGSNTLTGFSADAAGNLTALGTTPTDGGPVDGAATLHGQFLYVQTGANGIVDEFRVGGDGSLTPIGSVTVPGAVGGEGIAAV